MRIADTEVAGLTGGLYESFDKLGLGFFAWLIGRVRAERLELEYKRVTAGAILVGATLGALVGLFIAVLAAALPKGTGDESSGCIALGATPLGALIGGILFLISAAIMIHYIRMLREDDVRSTSVSKSGASFDSILAERNQKNLDAGYPPKDAYREAWWFAALTTGVARRL
jgi:hypothetical protein